MRRLLAVVAWALVPLVACAPSAAPPPQPTTAPPTTGASSAVGTMAPLSAPPAARPATTLKLATLRPAADAGIFIALERGYYQEEGIELEMAQVDVGAQTIG